MPKNIALLITRDATDMCTVSYSDKPDLLASWIDSPGTDLTEEIFAHVLELQAYRKHPLAEAELRYELEAPYDCEWDDHAYNSKVVRISCFLPPLLGNCGDGVIVVAEYDGNMSY